MRNVRHFGNTMVHFGDEGDAMQLDQGTKQTSSSGGSEEEGLGGGCSKSMCQSMAAASKLAMGALGPAGQLIGASQMAAYAADKSPAGQAQYQAALAHNERVSAQNAQRSEIIDQFVKDAVGGQVTKEQMVLGDKALSEYAKMKAKYGDQIQYMTLQELVTAYPEDSKAVVVSLAQVFPALRGKGFDEVWANIPETFKGMQLIDLEHAIPNSSWAGTTTSTGASVASKGVSAPVAVGGLAALAAIAFVLLRK